MPANALNETAMDALDAHIVALRQILTKERHDQDANDDNLTALAKPSICDLPTLLAQLERQQAQSSAAVLIRWQDLIDAHAIADLPNDTLPQRCAIYESLTLLLETALKESLECQPMVSALRLVALVADVPSDYQPEISNLLSNLTQQHLAADAAQKDPRMLCPIYNQIESRMLDLRDASAP